MNKEIFCTLGPSSFDIGTIKKLEAIGVSLFRINLSHTPLSDLEYLIQYIKGITNVPLCLDTEGAQIRTGSFRGGSAMLRENSFIKVSEEFMLGTSVEFNLYPRNIIRHFRRADLVSIDFNSAFAQVVDVTGDNIILRVLTGGLAGSNKAVTVNRAIDMPALTQKDITSIGIGKEYGLNDFALSFAGSKKDVQELRTLVGNESKIISKIESRRGLANLDGIIKSSDAILIDRGDLSREIPIERIPAVQKFILKAAIEHGRKAFVATNLLESMIDNPFPTRAEVNDIYNTLKDGSSGLVLAAETAIGNYPVECAKMARRVIREFDRGDIRSIDDNQLEPHDENLIRPHGGALVNQLASMADEEEIPSLKTISIGTDLASDCYQIGVGVYSPLSGFMDQDTLTNVLTENRTPEGDVWPLPVVLPVPEHVAKEVNLGQRVVLSTDLGDAVALLDIADIYPIEFEWVTSKWFGTSSKRHPGVSRFSKMGNFCLGGKILLTRNAADQRSVYDLSPAHSRMTFRQKGWNYVVGFHTRNVAHRAHEFLLLESLRRSHADGLFINPIIGEKKVGDFLPDPIMKSYQLLIESGVLPDGKVVLGGFSTYPRYSGPREAVFTALCRKNMGCNYFVIGRDHVGVGNFYEAEANRQYFDLIGDIGISPIFFDIVGFNRDTRNYSEGEDETTVEPISGTRFRHALKQGSHVPDWFVRTVVQEMLVSEVQAGRKIVYE